ncbi:TIGR04219 family outer membrane beta-barrel protein [Thioalkalivibrio sp. ALE19]|uniref:TIGR04219 family outer membrane beta-barrel protein n=1 Tax=Thioalkalivibrio sp. ALE19 TaxID=1266909 RepID=UPI0003FCF4A7|nr:TIGR04219 family outer membrane beta-barrel protein [Thioalkalivibrio sp. ALE19]
MPKFHVLSRLGAGLILAAAAAPATAVDIEIGGQGWAASPGGDIQHEGDEWSLGGSEDGLGMDRSTAFQGEFELRHGIPFVPNVQARHSRFSTDGDGEVTAEREFAGETFQIGSDVATDFDLDMTDLILSYRILDRMPTVDLDLGVHVRHFDGSVQAEGDYGVRGESSFSAPVPMLYARGTVDLPLTGVSLKGEGSAIGYDGHMLRDLRAAARYTFDSGVGLELGYREFRLDIDDLDDVTADIRMDGPYAGVRMTF